MPQWKTLRDDEIAAVTTYIRANFGNRAPPIDAAFVAAERAKPADRTVPWSGGEELEDLP
jgi:mono/diheme cytochrome c family protein